VILFSKE